GDQRRCEVDRESGRAVRGLVAEQFGRHGPFRIPVSAHVTDGSGGGGARSRVPARTQFNGLSSRFDVYAINDVTRKERLACPPISVRRSSRGASLWSALALSRRACSDASFAPSRHATV